jgi:hypothetical protein
MVAGPMVGIGEVLIVLLMTLGIPLPFGVPPQPEDPAFLKAAPAETILFVEWFGAGEANAESANATERLVANTEVREFASAIKRAIRGGISRDAPRDAWPVINEAINVVTLLLGRPGCLFVSGVDLGPQMPSVSAGIVANLAGKTADANRSLAGLERFLLKEMGGGENAPPPSTVTVEGVEFHVLPLPPPVPPVAWGFSGDYLIIAVGEGMPAKIVKGLAAGPGLAGAEAVQKLFAKVKVERPCSRVYIDIAQILEKVAPLGGPEVTSVLDALGVTGVTAFVSEAGLEGPGFVSKGLVATRGAPAGLLRLAEGAPLGDEELAVIPRDATLAVAMRLNAETVYREFLAAIEKIEPRARQEFEREVEGGLERELGLTIADDILAPLGDAWCVWSSPSQGGLLVSGLTVAVTVKDRARLEKTLDKIVDAMRREMGPRSKEGRGKARGAHVEKCTFKDTKIFYLNVVGEEFPFAPAWCLTDRHLMVSLFPQMLKATLARGSDVESSIARHPALKNRGAAVALSAFDTPEIARLLYPALHVIAQLACGELQREGLDLTVAALPSAQSILPNLVVDVSTVERIDGGILMKSCGSIPNGNPIVSVLLPLVTIGYARAAPVGMPHTSGPMTPAEPDSMAPPTQPPPPPPPDQPPPPAVKKQPKKAAPKKAPKQTPPAQEMKEF